LEFIYIYDKDEDDSDQDDIGLEFSSNDFLDNNVLTSDEGRNSEGEILYNEGTILTIQLNERLYKQKGLGKIDNSLKDFIFTQNSDINGTAEFYVISKSIKIDLIIHHVFDMEEPEFGIVINNKFYSLDKDESNEWKCTFECKIEENVNFRTILYKNVASTKTPITRDYNLNELKNSEAIEGCSYKTINDTNVLDCNFNL
jgi:hypothetical protein